VANLVLFAFVFFAAFNEASGASACRLGVVFNIASLWKFFHAACPAIVTFPLRALFLSAFQRFSFGELNF
jgi:hypothetical protein